MDGRGICRERESEFLEELVMRTYEVNFNNELSQIGECVWLEASVELQAEMGIGDPYDPGRWDGR